MSRHRQSRLSRQISQLASHNRIVSCAFKRIRAENHTPSGRQGSDRRCVMSRATSRRYKLNVVQRVVGSKRTEELAIPLRYVT